MRAEELTSWLFVCGAIFASGQNVAGLSSALRLSASEHNLMIEASRPPFPDLGGILRDPFSIFLDIFEGCVYNPSSQF
ncbi:hypothetical protein CEXT_399121 [Caerostris extrusa]|uniref:Uncharacterized protein n=1 Tax=Caerostris extrusa TaxID=172846 RepID=A0AAV4XEJ4_CAEEX|nr:hypothetical protein CEXT_399121 [Caerostris extrusa]